MELIFYFLFKEHRIIQAVLFHLALNHRFFELIKLGSTLRL